MIIIILYKYISLQNKKKILKKDDDLKKYREGVIRKFQIQEWIAGQKMSVHTIIYTTKHLGYCVDLAFIVAYCDWKVIGKNI